MLFRNIDRTDAAPKRQSETLFTFYDRTSRPEFGTYRGLLEGWLAEMPLADAAGLVAQMKESGDLGFESGLVELVTYASFVRLGYRVEVHPALKENKNRPDFLLRSTEGEPLVYLEVTTINPASDDVADERREGLIHDRLNRVRLPKDMRLSYQVVKRGTDSPSVNRLTADVEIWARDEEEAARSGDVAERLFRVGGWEIGLRLVPGFKPRPGGPQIAFSVQRGFSMDAAEPGAALMAALDRKATRYGDLGLPLVLVVADRTERLAYLAGDFAENVAGGLFGPEITEGVEHRDGRWELRHRRGDGFWFRKGRPDHTGVSAVLVFPQAEIWKLREKRWQPLLVQNPNATRPLPPEISLPWHELVMAEKEGTVRPRRVAGDILGLPEPWPPEH